AACAARMMRTLNSEPKRRTTRNYVATLPKRAILAHVAPAEFGVIREKAIKALARHIVGTPSVVRKDRVRPAVRHYDGEPIAPSTKRSTRDLDLCRLHRKK